MAVARAVGGRGTELSYDADASVGGTIGGVGQRMLAGSPRRWPASSSPRSMPTSQGASGRGRARRSGGRRPRPTRRGGRAGSAVAGETYAGRVPAHGQRQCHVLDGREQRALPSARWSGCPRRHRSAPGLAVGAAAMRPSPRPLSRSRGGGALPRGRRRQCRQVRGWTRRCVAETGAELVVLPESATTGFTPGIPAEALWGAHDRAAGHRAGCGHTHRASG